MLLVVANDWRRGKTGLGRLRITKKDDPEKYWMAICLYLNMAFVLFWLAGSAAQARPACNPGQQPCTAISR